MRRFSLVSLIPKRKTPKQRRGFAAWVESIAVKANWVFGSDSVVDRAYQKRACAGVKVMRVGLLGRKVGMTQIYEPDGTAVPITVLECGPCTVLQIRTAERDGYHALQLGFDDKKRKSASKAERGHCKKVDAEPKRFVRELRQDAPAADIKEGQTLTVDVFNGIKGVDVTGTSKGRGFTGAMKRHGFKGLRATHGVKRMHRHPGSSGPSADPSRTRKGIRKPGHHGAARITVRNLKVERVDAANNLLLVRGAVPGADGGYLMISQTNVVG